MDKSTISKMKNPFMPTLVRKNDVEKARRYFQCYYGINTALKLLNTDITACFKRRMIKYTNVQNNVGKVCKNCGSFYMSNKYTKFCSNACANKYLAKRREEMTMRLTMNAITNDEAKEFYKQWNNLAYSEIYKYPKYRDDLIALWQVKGLYILRFCKKQKMDFRHKNLVKVVKNSIKYNFLNIEKERKNEVFYAECSYKTQNKILGTSIEEV